MTTSMPSSLEIAQEAHLRPISEIAAAAGLEPDEVDLYGKYKAKVSLSVLDRLADRPDGKLVGVTAITPTKAGEGKTTTAVSLTQGLGHIGKNVVLCLREPRSARCSGSRAAPPAPATPRSCRWRTSTSTSPATSTRSAPRTTFSPRCSRRTSSTATRSGSTPWRSAGGAAWTSTTARSATSSSASAASANGYARETGFDITAASEVMAIVAVVARPPGPARTARLDHRRQHLRRAARDRRAAEGRRLDGGAAQGDDQAEPRPDARGPAGVRPLRPVRQHRARQQLARLRPRRAQARRHRADRERLRLRHGHGEVLRHRLPGRRAEAERCRARRDREGAQAPRRRPGRRRRGDRARRRRT